MMFGLGSFNLINEFERAFNESNAEHLASSSARLEPYSYHPQGDIHLTWQDHSGWYPKPTPLGERIF